MEQISTPISTDCGAYSAGVVVVVRLSWIIQLKHSRPSIGVTQGRR